MSHADAVGDRGRKDCLEGAGFDLALDDLQTVRAAVHHVHDAWRVKARIGPRERSATRRRGLLFATLLALGFWIAIGFGVQALWRAASATATSPKEAGSSFRLAARPKDR